MPTITTTTITTSATQDNQTQLRPRTTSPQPFFNHSPQKSHDRSSLSNAFVWASEANAEHGHVDTSSEFFMTNLKTGSFQSLPYTNKSVVSSHGRERSHSRNGSLLSVGAASARDRGELYSKDHHHLTNGRLAVAQSDGAHIIPLTNGVDRVHFPSDPNYVLDTDRSSTDILSTEPEPTPPTSIVPTPVTEGAQLGLLLQPVAVQTTQRHSSPPAALQTDFEHSTSPPSPHSPRLVHRHTLQVPRAASARKNAREVFAPSPSDDNLTVSDRFSAASGIRRGSLSLVRRTPRSVQSDLHLEEGIPQDEDAARWTEAIKHRRASKRKKREEEDDDRVIVGTKVDQNHVNWVTAYNMLTGIRFTVSRTNAKMDRDLTNADFEAKHKFSFDM